MKTNKHIDKEVERTMQALDDLEPAKTDAFFYSRLQAKLEHRNQPEGKPVWKFDFGFAAAAAIVLLFISVNAAVLLQTSGGPEAQVPDREEFMNQLAADYQVVDLSYFEPVEQNEDE